MPVETIKESFLSLSAPLFSFEISQCSSNLFSLGHHTDSSCCFTFSLQIDQVQQAYKVFQLRTRTSVQWTQIGPSSCLENGWHSFGPSGMSGLWCSGNEVGFLQRTPLIRGDSSTAMSKSTQDREKVKRRKKIKRAHDGRQ